jgi:hypothetical protein
MPSPRRWVGISLLLVTLPLLLIALGAGPAGAATGLAFMKNGVDARSTMLGEAVSAHVDDASACYWNPSGMLNLERSQIMLSHTESFADLRREYLAAVTPLGDMTAGIFFNGIWTDDIKGYDASANPTGNFGYSEYAAGISLAMPIPAGFQVGASAKYLNSSIEKYSATGWAADLGVQWASTPESPLRLGLAMQNLGPKMSYIEEEFDLPLTFQGGASYLLDLPSANGRFLLAADVRGTKDEDTAFLFGAEYTYDNTLSLGVGYQDGRDTRDLSLGLGFEIKAVALNYAYIPIDQDLGDEHRLSLRINL